VEAVWEKMQEAVPRAGETDIFGIGFRCLVEQSLPDILSGMPFNPHLCGTAGDRQPNELVSGVD